MNPVPDTLGRESTQAALIAALREVHGVRARLERWTADPLMKRGKHRVVRYEIHARVPEPPHVRRCHWVGKFYERDEVGLRVARILGELARTDCGVRGGFVIPTVLAYEASCRLLLLTYQPGESVISAIAQNGAMVLSAIGRALAALHTASIRPDLIASPLAVLEDLRQRISELRARFPFERDLLRQILDKLERQTPDGPATPSFLHGDFGPSQLLWQSGRLVILDFDKYARGDPAFDLGNLLIQFRRIALRKPGKLPEFAPLRGAILEAYRHWSPHDPELDRRVAWHEQVALVRKIHFLAYDLTRRQGADALRERQAEANRLLAQLRAPGAGADVLRGSRPGLAGRSRHGREPHFDTHAT